ncbi:MAG: hypothetical protein A2Z14_15115 [Chloroflexi bacterium RBG_16_48_8]|nr:MAG: hypothetical protein A2Z14_15115 [Chloroflexi bacterium RBG_16_48_8]
MRNLRVSILLGLLILLSISSNQQVILVYQDIPYCYRGNPRQILDIVISGKRKGPYPTLFLIHGGGFQTGSKEDLYSIAQYFTDLGCLRWIL